MYDEYDDVIVCLYDNMYRYCRNPKISEKKWPALSRPTPWRWSTWRVARRRPCRCACHAQQAQRSIPWQMPWQYGGFSQGGIHFQRDWYIYSTARINQYGMTTFAMFWHVNWAWHMGCSSSSVNVNRLRYKMAHLQMIYLTWWYETSWNHTSSTAQGGGGSFKNRKPIGEIWLLWIIDGRAKSLMDRKVIDVSHLSLSFFSLSLSLLSPLSLLIIYLPTYLPPTYLPIYLSIHPSIYLSTYLSIYLFIYLSIYLIYLIYLSNCVSRYLPIYLSTYLPIYLSICLSVCLPVYLQAWKPGYSTRLSSFFQVDNIKNAALLRDFLIFWSWPSFFEVDHIKNEAILRDLPIFWSWPHQKRSNSARLPQFLNLTTSKTKQFCETSFKNGKLTAELTASCQCILRFF